MKAQPIHTGPDLEHVVDVINPDGQGAFVLVCEHASNSIPAELDNLGLEDELLDSHIAWDPGALSVARALSQLLDAPLIAPAISRLVYDCNRAPGLQSCVPILSEHHEIPGNMALDPALCRERAERYYEPFVQALDNCLDARAGSGQRPVLMTIHSFTPVFKGVKRRLDIGLLYDDDARFARAMLRAGEEQTGLKFAMNEPYGPNDEVTHTLKEHGIRRGLLNVMVEIRNDLIADESAQIRMAQTLAELAVSALEGVKGGFPDAK